MKISVYAFHKKLLHSLSPLPFISHEARGLGHKANALRRLIGQASYRALILLPIIGAFLKKRVIREFMNDGGVSILLKDLFTTVSDRENYLASLPSRILLDYDAVLHGLEALQLKRIRHSLIPDRKTVAFHFPSPAYRENVGSIARKLRDKGYNVLLLIGTICNDIYEKQPFVFFWGSGINKIDFVDVFVSITLSDNLPVNAKKVLFIHDIHDSPLGDTDSFLKLALPYDYFAVASDYVIVRLKQVFSKADVKNKEICLLKTGYTKLDRNLAYLETNSCTSEALIYAPTITGLDFEAMVSLPNFGDKIIEALLNNFPDLDVIFRPHPHSLHTDVVKDIVRRFADCPKFHLDSDGSFYMGNYAKSALMITDMSGTAYTYTFTTLKPVVFFSHNEPEVLRRFGSYQYFKDRAKVGYIAQNIDELVEKIKLLLATPDKFRQSIKEYRDSTIYNIGKSEDYFVDNFEYIIEDKKHPDWIYI